MVKEFIKHQISKTDSYRVLEKRIKSLEDDKDKLIQENKNLKGKLEKEDKRILKYKKYSSFLRDNLKIELESQKELMQIKELHIHSMKDYLNQTENKLRKTEKQLEPFKNRLKSSEELVKEKDILIEYMSGNKRPFLQRLISKFPSLYILFNVYETGIKNALINIKGYNAIKKSNSLDIGFYLNKYPDIKLSGMDPVLHYIYHGFKEGKKPNPKFDGEYYLKKYSDVRNSNLNPLVHYCLYGIKEKRRIEEKKPSIKTGSSLKKTYSNQLIPLEKSSNKEITTKKISIKLPAGNWNTAKRWGDYHFALALKKEFERNNHIVHIHVSSEWDREDDADVVLVLRGLKRYKPKAQNYNIMWNISHPEMVSLEEYNEYDYVFVASEKLADELKSKIRVPVEPLLQCTDPELFYPEHSSLYEHDLLFVGNTRGEFRKIIKDLLPTDKDLGLYGNQWENFVDDKHICNKHIPNMALHKAYYSSKILLNDHWKDMCELGFISNRIFDGFASGAFIISDEVEGAKEIFGDTLVTYQNRDDLNKLINYYLEHEEEREKLARKGRDIVLNNHTFKKRAEHISKLINQ